MIIRVVELSKQTSSYGPTKELKNIFQNCFLMALNSKNVSFENKFTIINSFANNTRGQGSEIHFRLEEAFKYLLGSWNNEIKEAIANVFHAYESQYYDGQKIIYTNEKNFFYVMYQAWSGNPDSAKEIKLIRQVAERGLEKNPEAILKYWSRYPYQEEWQNLKFSESQNFMMLDLDGGNELYMPLEVLIGATKKAGIIDGLESGKVNLWERWLKNGEYVSPAIRQDTGTLHAALIHRELIRPII
jgi:hypothetical protein